jgi:uncharacterized protein (DUF362 family)/Pyruvate/2-oxoacid:ferredoxin oxidoreductase delta subunit
MIPVVSLVRQTDYALAPLRDSIIRLLAPLGGMEKFVQPGNRVALKLNLVCPTRGVKIAYTQAEIFQVVAELARDCGGRVFAGDSPGVGSAAQVAKLAGIAAVAQQLEVPLVEFTGKEVFDDRRVFKKLTLARELLEADVVINLPRLKTHGQMLLTAATKNLFGAVIGTEKFAWHYRAGRDYATFARMLYEICGAVKPALHLVDAVVAMQGAGPTAGEPCATNFLAASTDPTALDATLMKILGKAPTELFTIQAALAAGDTAWQNTELAGDLTLAALRPATWRWAPAHSLAMVSPRLLRWVPFLTEEKFRRWTAVYPRVVPDKCVRCGKCVELCPAQALRLDGAKLHVAVDKCIRCYCCHELCPQHALELQGGWFSKFTQALNALYKKF